MNTKEFNESLKKYFDAQNSVGLGELLLFGKSFRYFFETQRRVDTLLHHIVDICGYQTSAREFVRRISYEDFKKRKGISEAMALGLKLFLIHHCGVFWENPDVEFTGMGDE